MRIRTFGVPITLTAAGALALSACGGSTSGASHRPTHAQIKNRLHERAPEYNLNHPSLTVSQKAKSGARTITVAKVGIGPEGKARQVSLAGT